MPRKPSYCHEQNFLTASRNISEQNWGILIRQYSDPSSLTLISRLMYSSPSFIDYFYRYFNVLLNNSVPPSSIPDERTLKSNIFGIPLIQGGTILDINVVLWQYYQRYCIWVLGTYHFPLGIGKVVPLGHTLYFRKGIPLYNQ